MADDVRVYEIATEDVASLNCQEICIETVNDSDLGYKMWGGKDADGNTTKWLAKEKPIKVTTIEGASLKLTTGSTIDEISTSTSLTGAAHDMIFTGLALKTYIDAAGIGTWTRDGSGYLYPTTTTDEIRVAEYIKRYGGPEEYIRFEDDKITIATNTNQVLISATATELNVSEAAIDTIINYDGGEAVKVDGATGYFGVGVDPTEFIDIGKNQNAGTKCRIKNGTAGSLAYAQFSAESESCNGTFTAFDDGYGVGTSEFTGKIALYANVDANALMLATAGSSAPIELYTGGNNPGDKCATFDSDGYVYFNKLENKTTHPASFAPVYINKADGELYENDTNIIYMSETTAPAAGVSNKACMWSQDDSGITHMYVQDSTGNQSKISPHNENDEWEYYSKNVNTGKVVRVNMESLIKEVENLSGKKFIYNK